ESAQRRRPSQETTPHRRRRTGGRARARTPLRSARTRPAPSERDRAPPQQSRLRATRDTSSAPRNYARIDPPVSSENGRPNATLSAMLVEFPERPRAGSDTGSAPLAEASASRVSDPGLVVAVIPAHDEQARIGKAIRSLDEQSSPPDLTIVCADDCTDRTAIAAEAAGADVIVTEGNEHGRAGAVNQALELL